MKAPAKWSLQGYSQQTKQEDQETKNLVFKGPVRKEKGQEKHDREKSRRAQQIFGAFLKVR